MQATTLTKALMTCVATSALLTTYGFAQGVHGKPLPKERAAADAASSSRIQVPNRPATAVFQGEQGKQNTEIFFDAATQIVTAKILVQDPNGYFIPNIRRDNFAVYENGVRQ